MLLLAFAAPGMMELCIIGGIVIVLFGAKSLPKLARSAGAILPSFKAGMKEVEKEAAMLNEELSEIKTSAKTVHQEIEAAVK